jgi:acyl-CoA dehydrogenase
MHTGNETDSELNFAMSAKALPLYNAVKKFIAEEVEPMAAKFYALGENRDDRWQYAPGQLELLEGVKSKAKAQGLWNFFLPNAETGEGLSNLDYAYIAVELGKSPLASESLNCSAPDTGNMEVLERVGTPAQKEKWLKPLLNGEIRSAYVMTEPDVASSDAKNLQCRAELDGDEWVITGDKYYASGAGDPRCKIYILMGKTDGDAPRHSQQSMILVPADTKGVTVVRPLSVFGYDDAPHGHCEVKFENVRVPVSNILLGEGRGFEIAQGRLGPGRIHHCMRAIGTAERALELMCRRIDSRVAFGKKVSEQGVWRERIAESRIMIDSARLLVLKAAYMMDTVGNKVAKSEIAMIKVLAPVMAQQIIDWSIQAHGGGGVSDDFAVAQLWAHNRTLRIADGPDEVHRNAIAKIELSKYASLQGESLDLPITRS